jgi:cytochrome c biogenesis protein CcmG, thiol:disulfide interchange protein DsbE
VVKRLSIPLIVGVLGAALVGLLVYGIATQAPSRSLDEALKHGAYPQAPSATHELSRLSGAGSESLADYRGKVVVLNFWASWCEPCQEEAPLLERAERKLARHDGTVLGVTYLDVTPDSLSFVKRYHLTYPNLRDTNGEFTHSYGTDQLPESFVINREGHIVALERGEIDEAFLNRAVSLAESS